MTAPAHWLSSLRPSDARGLAGIATQATLELTDVVEGVHQAVLGTLGAPVDADRGRTRGITGLVYRSIRGITRLAGAGVGSTLMAAEFLSRSAGHAPGQSPERDAVIAALNGVMGDRLAATANPLATVMEMRIAGSRIEWQNPDSIAGASRKVLLLIHGLCMSDQHWISLAPPGQIAHGEALAAELGYTPVYLRYNSGLSIPENGMALAQQLETLVEHWPAPLEEITLLGHSMGGLLARSALQQAEALSHAWPQQVRHLITLGTPHHGAPMERAGAWVEYLLDSTPFTRPFRALGRLRSAGIRDLRFGRVLENDATGADRDEYDSALEDTRSPCPLPRHISAYAVAATRSPAGASARNLTSDGLVPVASALGQHQAGHHKLGFPPAAQFIVPDTHHLGLLSSPAVTRQLLHWLAPG